MTASPLAASPLLTVVREGFPSCLVSLPFLPFASRLIHNFSSTHAPAKPPGFSHLVLDLGGIIFLHPAAVTVLSLLWNVLSGRRRRIGRQPTYHAKEASLLSHQGGSSALWSTYANVTSITSGV